ncbi:MAG: tetratricopeptide repeat protein [Candidatus Omnitrophica bacterium]|nr:tetratricopeptide repeat protein [Candidatus Omnitrophota bacterium]
MLRSRTLHIILLVLAAVFVYANSLGGDFVYDDKPMIVQYDLIHQINNLPRAFTSPTTIYGNVNYYRPLQTASYMIDYFLWGEYPAGFHLTNILLHIAVVIMVYTLILLLFKSRPVAFMAAVMFCVHPVHTTVVSYIAGRADSMLCVFMLGCFVSYIKFRYGGKSLAVYALSVFFFGLSLMAKETAMIIPFAIALFELYGRRYTKVQAPQRKGPWQAAFWAVLLLYVLFRATKMSFFVEGAMAPFPLANRLMTAPYVAGQYFRLLFLPVDLHMGRQPWLASTLFEGKVLLSLVAVGLIYFYAYRMRKKEKAVWFGLLWFAVMIFPTLNIIAPLFYTIAENWLYVPSIGLFLAIAAVASSIYAKLASSSVKVTRWAVTVLVGMYVATMAAVTVSHNRVWKNEITLGLNTIRFSPREFKIYNNVGVAYLSRGDLDKAEEYFWKCLEIKPDTGMAYFNLYRVYMRRGDRAKARQYLDRARELDPGRVGILIKKMGITDQI